MQTPAPDCPSAQRTTPAFVLALALLGGLTWGGFQVWPQVRALPSAASAKALRAAAAAAVAAANQNSASDKNAKPTPTAGPAWTELNAAQKKALAPLASRWSVTSELQKRHWLALAKNFPALPTAEQQRLHARMTAWASLSAQQRSQARLNFAVTNQLSAGSKRAQWEAYQALSDEEKSRLAAAAAARRSRGAATTLQPVDPNKLVQVPATSALSHPSTLPSADNPTAQVETTPVAIPTAVPTALPPLPPLPPLPHEVPTETTPLPPADVVIPYAY